MIQLIKKHWSNIVFVVAIILVLNPTSKEWLIKTIAFSPSVNSEQPIHDLNWKLKGLNTENIDLKDLKGKVVFVNFWATWCPPCRAEMPAIQKLYNTYKEDVVFLFVSQESKDVILKFTEKYGYNLPMYNAASSIPKALNTTNSIPATYVIDKNGTIVISVTGASKWDSKSTFKIFDKLLE